MRTLIVVVGSVVALLVALGVSAQERSERLTAEVFIGASFPKDVIEAARKADAVALSIAETRREVEFRLKEAKRVYDDALLRPDVSIVQLISAHKNYSTILLEYWSVDQDLKIADILVRSTYSAWTDGADPSSAQLFQRWYEAAYANYTSVISGEEGDRLMLHMGIDRINRKLRQKQGRHKAPTIRRVND